MIWRRRTFIKALSTAGAIGVMQPAAVLTFTRTPRAITPKDRLWLCAIAVSAVMGPGLLALRRGDDVLMNLPVGVGGFTTWESRDRSFELCLDGVTHDVVGGVFIASMTVRRGDELFDVNEHGDFLPTRGRA